MLLFCAVAGAGEIKKLDGTVLVGDVVAVTGMEVKYLAEGKEQAVPLKEVMGIDLGTALRNVPRVPYLRVKLNDGSMIYCLALGMKGKMVELVLLTGQTISTSLEQIQHVVCDAQETPSLLAFDAIISDNPKADVVRVQSREGNTIDPYEGVIVGANAEGTRLQFKAEGRDTVSNIDMTRLRGLYFSRSNIGPGPQAVARIYDTHGDVFTATKFTFTATSCELTTQTGFSLMLPRAVVQKFDLTPGKLVYLSDLEPARVEETPILADLYRYRRDKNLEGGPLSVARKVYAKGLALHSKTVLEYDVVGFSTFRCVLGLDDAMAGTAHAVVKIEGDGKELLSSIVSSKESKAQEVSLAIAGVQKLRLIVDYGEDLDLGDHVNFADARVIK